MGTRADSLRAAARQRHDARRSERQKARKGEGPRGPSLEELAAQLAEAARGPLREVRVNASWSTRGLAALVYTRDRPDNDVAVAWLLLDLSRFGLLYCTASAAVSLGERRDTLDRLEAALGPSQRLPPSEAGALLARALRQGATAGWAPDPAWPHLAPFVGPLPEAVAGPTSPLPRALRATAELARHEAHRAPQRLHAADHRALFSLLEHLEPAV